MSVFAPVSNLTFRCWLLLVVVAVSHDCCAQNAVPNTPPVLLQMIRDDLIHDDLKLKPAQIEQVRTILTPIDGDWFRSRQSPPDKQRGEIDMLTKQLLQKLSSVLDRNQMQRLAQLERQALGTRMLVRKDVATKLGVGKQDHERLIENFVKTDEKVAKLQSQIQKGELTNEEGQREIARLQAAEREVFKDRLTTAQRIKLGPLTGKPFDFTKVKRIYPLAPELADEGVSWIQGGPLKLADLQGKVVAVHYYAYQCINCQRNLPHYKAWHDDYADKGLVIIGIQTPETSSERSFEKVKAAAAKDGIEYPVFLDASKSNWNTWKNTMWPTVYLIDKKGYIRRWWQGEMNWKGTPGEQQMRGTIEQLLAEDG